MSDPWFLLESGPTAAALNMAFDEALLEHCAAWGRPVLRFYGWTGPAATFGYFQRHTEIAALIPLRPLIRRPTGGGLVPHERDWTYCVTVPPGHAWYETRAVESYRRMHEWLRDSFTRLGLPTELAPCCDESGPGQCFGGGWEQYDLLYHGRKLAGAAQRRNKLGLLIQGSVQPLPQGVEREAWQKAMTEAAAGVTWAGLEITPGLLARVKDLAATKYSSPGHNERR